MAVNAAVRMNRYMRRSTHLVEQVGLALTAKWRVLDETKPKTWAWQLGRNVFAVRENEATCNARTYVYARFARLPGSRQYTLCGKWRVRRNMICGFTVLTFDGQPMSFAEWKAWARMLRCLRKQQGDIERV